MIVTVLNVPLEETDSLHVGHWNVHVVCSLPGEGIVFERSCRHRHTNYDRSERCRAKFQAAIDRVGTLEAIQATILRLRNGRRF